MIRDYRRLPAGLIALLLASLACSLFTGQPAEEAPNTEIPAPQKASPQPGMKTEPPSAKGNELLQWAISAAASSEFGEFDWSAKQATGAPDTAECGDLTTAWASAAAGSIEWLELKYEKAVRPTQVVIYQTYNPSQVVRVELIDTQGGYHEVFSDQPQTRPCPYKLVVAVPPVQFLAAGVKITVDQTAIQDWNEIDAVQLVGFVE